MPADAFPARSGVARHQPSTLALTGSGLGRCILTRRIPGRTDGVLEAGGLLSRRRGNGGTPAPPERLPRLTVARSELEQQLQDRIALGEELLKRPITSEADLRSVRSDYYTWTEYNETLLRRSFTTSKPADDYRGGIIGGFGGPETLADQVRDLHGDIERHMRVCQRRSTVDPVAPVHF
jgi:hypothetical protein